jgi:hypothetical protein
LLPRTEFCFTRQKFWNWADPPGRRNPLAGRNPTTQPETIPFSPAQITSQRSTFSIPFPRPPPPAKIPANSGDPCLARGRSGRPASSGLHRRRRPQGLQHASNLVWAMASAPTSPSSSSFPIQAGLHSCSTCLRARTVTEEAVYEVVLRQAALVDELQGRRAREAGAAALVGGGGGGLRARLGPPRRRLRPLRRVLRRVRQDLLPR